MISKTESINLVSNNKRSVSVDLENRIPFCLLTTALTVKSRCAVNARAFRLDHGFSQISSRM